MKKFLPIIVIVLVLLCIACLVTSYFGIQALNSQVAETANEASNQSTGITIGEKVIPASLLISAENTGIYTYPVRFPDEALTDSSSPIKISQLENDVYVFESCSGGISRDQVVVCAAAYQLFGDKQIDLSDQQDGGSYIIYNVFSMEDWGGNYQTPADVIKECEENTVEFIATNSEFGIIAFYPYEKISDDSGKLNPSGNIAAYTKIASDNNLDEIHTCPVSEL